MKLLLAIACGGALGALGRHFVAQQMSHWLGSGFPWGTFTVNLLGSFVLGVLVETLALAVSISPPARGFLVVGMLGGFTTFSAFSLDTVLLAERGRMDLVALYVGGSIVAAVGGLVAGLRFIRLVLG